MTEHGSGEGAEHRTRGDAGGGREPGHQARGFGESLSDEERAVLNTVVNAGVEIMAPEVAGYVGKGEIHVESWPFGLSASASNNLHQLGQATATMEAGNPKAGDTSPG